MKRHKEKIANEFAMRHQSLKYYFKLNFKKSTFENLHMLTVPSSAEQSNVELKASKKCHEYSSVINQSRRSA